MRLVVMGVSGCGKTTVGQAVSGHLQLQFLDGDDFHPPASRDKMARSVPLTDRDREPWLERLAEVLAEKDCVLACSALKRKYRETMIKYMPEGERVLFIYLMGSKEVIEKRLTKRQGHYFKAELLQSQFDALEEPDDDENVFAIDCEETLDRIVEKVSQIVEKCDRTK
eukprot:GFUD01034431.1.p1 GENE.GFUD01034431.1~~GFUD01034431.1.p1  ORF type:complete len:181 (+),score=77.86 GFUD01034431.1:40-543(+)